MIEGRRALSRWSFAAAAWAFLFALPNFYWAAGGETGSGTIAADPRAALGAGAEPGPLLAIGIAKVALGVVVLWVPGARLGRGRSVRIAAQVVAAGIVLYGVATLVEHLLMLTGVRGIPPVLGEAAVRWHAFFWDPYWILGGLLLGLAARSWAPATGDEGDVGGRDAFESREGVRSSGG